MLDQQIDLVEILRSGEDSRLRRYRPERNDTPTSPAVVLFCGADQEAELDWDEHRPWVVEILPETEPPPARKRQKRSNGCGARIHARAMADRRWRGLVEGISMDVVRLEDEYFTPDMKRELLLGKERCGCCRSGVGCAIWSVFLSEIELWMHEVLLLRWIMRFVNVRLQSFHVVLGLHRVGRLPLHHGSRLASFC
jgi:hypothetical protein